jgi:glycosyltransferase involved in cell wall biosynthesis
VLDSAGIDLIHALGDCFVSLSHGEAWGLGAFEAATRGTPVITTAWGGHLDYLGDDWPGAVRCRLAPAPVWPPYQPSYFPSQRWAEPDLDAAARLLRLHERDRAPMQLAAQGIGERIAERFAEPRVWHDWRAVLE